MTVYLPDYIPVVFTARCPCGTEATWTAFMARTERGTSAPHHHIDCPRCGKCACEHHEPVEGVAA